MNFTLLKYGDTVKKENAGKQHKLFPGTLKS